MIAACILMVHDKKLFHIIFWFIWEHFIDKTFFWPPLTPPYQNIFSLPQSNIAQQWYRITEEILHSHIIRQISKAIQNHKSVINYSPSCHSKPVRPSFIFGTQIKIFLMKSESYLTLHRQKHNWNVPRSRNVVNTSVKQSMWHQCE